MANLSLFPVGCHGGGAGQMASTLLVICSGHWVIGVGQDPPSAHTTVRMPENAP